MSRRSSASSHLVGVVGFEPPSWHALISGAQPPLPALLISSMDSALGGSMKRLLELREATVKHNFSPGWAMLLALWSDLGAGLSLSTCSLSPSSLCVPFLLSSPPPFAFLSSSPPLPLRSFPPLPPSLCIPFLPLPPFALPFLLPLLPPAFLSSSSPLAFLSLPLAFLSFPPLWVGSFPSILVGGFLSFLPCGWVGGWVPSFLPCGWVGSLLPSLWVGSFHSDKRRVAQRAVCHRSA